MRKHKYIYTHVYLYRQSVVGVCVSLITTTSPVHKKAGRPYIIYIYIYYIYIHMYIYKISCVYYVCMYVCMYVCTYYWHAYQVSRPRRESHVFFCQFTCPGSSFSRLQPFSVFSGRGECQSFRNEAESHKMMNLT